MNGIAKQNELGVKIVISLNGLIKYPTGNIVNKLAWFKLKPAAVNTRTNLFESGRIFIQDLFPNSLPPNFLLTTIPFV